MAAMPPDGPGAEAAPVPAAVAAPAGVPPEVNAILVPLGNHLTVSLSSQCLTLLCPEPEPELEPEQVETSSLHGGPPGNRALTMRHLRTQKWVVDPSHSKYDPAKPGGWKNSKIMTSACPHLRESQTHICVEPMGTFDGEGQPHICGMTYSCARTTKFKDSAQSNVSRGVAFTNTASVAHRLKHHGEITQRKADAEKARLLAAAAAGTLPTNAEAAVDPSKSAQRQQAKGVMAKFVADGIAERAITRQQNQKAMLCRWFVFSRQRLSHAIFSCPDHKKVLVAGDPNYASFNPKDVNGWTLKSFLLFLLMMAHVLNLLDDANHGNAFWQALHDGVTVSHVKFQSFGMQFVWDKINWLVCFGFCHVLDGTGPGIVKGLRDCMGRIEAFRLKLRAAGFARAAPHTPMEELMGSCMQDYAAKSVARLLQQEEEGCEMHNEDKVIKFALGVPGVARVGTDPCPESLEFMKQVCLLALNWHHTHYYA